MGKSYSHDLRLKVLQAIDGGMKKRKAHQTFGISRSTIDDWLRQREQVGHVRALPGARRGKEPALGDLQEFEVFARRHKDATLEQMSQAWKDETGDKLSRNTFSLALKKLGWTRKKKSSLPRAPRVTARAVPAAAKGHRTRGSGVCR